MDDGLVDFGKGVVTPYKNLLEEILALTHDHAEALGCLQEAGFAREILRRGTSAPRQLDAFSQACSDGADKQEAPKPVVDWLIAEPAPPTSVPPKSAPRRQTASGQHRRRGPANPTQRGRVETEGGSTWGN